MRLDSLFEDEASDLASRDAADEAFDAVRDYLRRHAEWLPEALQSIDSGPFAGGFLLTAGRLNMGANPDLSYIFIPSKHEGVFRASLGSYQGGKQYMMILSVLIRPNDTTHLSTRFTGTHTDFVHEFQHYLMRHRQKHRKGGSTDDLEKGGHAAYFNNADETNAYYQEAVHRFMGLMKAIRNSDFADKAVLDRKMDFWRKMSTQELVNLILSKYTQPDFREHASPETMRAFKKRLARFVSQTLKPYIDPPIASA